MGYSNQKLCYIFTCIIFFIVHYLAKMEALYRVFNPIRSFDTSLLASSCLLYLPIHHLAKMADTC